MRNDQVNIVMPPPIKQRIDEYVEHHGINVSVLLRMAAVEFLDRRKLELKDAVEME